jgi:hypothetical protein
MKRFAMQPQCTHLFMCVFALCVETAPATADTLTLFSDRGTWTAAAGGEVQNLDFAPLNPAGSYKSGMQPPYLRLH